MSTYVIDPNVLADLTRPEMDFLDSSFFNTKGVRVPQLPSPESIIKKYGHGGRRVIFLDKPPIVVKVQDIPRLEEVQTMRAIRSAFPQGEIVIPEVFGWKRHKHQVFVYMSVIQGITLNDAWPTLTSHDKKTLQQELRKVVHNLRQIVQKVPQQIGSAGGGPVQDFYFFPRYTKGPFPNIKAFNDWIFAAAIFHPPDQLGPVPDLNHPDMYREYFPDDGTVHFTHADLAPRNIMVSGKPGSYHISGIIDWEQSGWYPKYWEYCKMQFCFMKEWEAEDWPGKVAGRYQAVSDAFAQYYLWRGAG